MAEMKELEKQLKIQDTLLKCVHTLDEEANVGIAIDRLLAIIADYHDAERSYIFEFTEDGLFLDNTYEWCKEGIEPQIDVLQHVEMSVIDRWIVQFEQKGEIYINSLDGELSKDSEEYKILEQQGIHSLMAAPLYLDGKLAGFLGVDNPAQNKDTLLLMRSVAAFVVNDMQKRIKVEHQIIGALAKVYVSMYLFNLSEDTYRELSSVFYIHDLLGVSGRIADNLSSAMKQLAEDSFADVLGEFMDITTLESRMQQTHDILSMECRGKISGWCRLSFIPVSKDEDGHLQKVVFAIQEIDEAKRRELEMQQALQRALRDENVVYARMLQMQSGGFIACKVSQNIVTIMNDAALKMFGWSSIEDFGAKYSAIVKKMKMTDVEKISADLEELQTAGGEEEYVYEYAIRQKEGGYVYVMAHAKVVTLQDGEKMLLHSLTDITDKKKMENQLRYLSQTDALTGIHNRGSGERRVQNLLEEGQKGMFCLLDIDKFKHINDTYGHGVGDKVLIALAQCLTQSFRSQDIVMRLGGDEFSIYAVGISDEEIGGRSIQRFFNAVNAIDIPELGDYKVSVSLGAVLCSGTQGVSFDQLYQMADTIMYNCKKVVGNKADFYRE